MAFTVASFTGSFTNTECLEAITGNVSAGGYGNSVFTPYVVNFGTNILTLSSGVIAQNGDFTLNYDSDTKRIYFDDGNGNTMYFEAPSAGSVTYVWFGFAYDDELQEGYYIKCERRGDSSSAQRNVMNNYTAHTKADIYYFLHGFVAPSYNWTSVPAISGKMGILSLTEILNINDGNAVNDVAASGNVDFSRKTKVNMLIEAAVEEDGDDVTKATIKYSIPKSNYEYTKLVYKKKKIPKSITDGTAIDILEDGNTANVSDLDPNTTYYFVIFTNKTRSEEYKYVTGEVIEAPPFKEQVVVQKKVGDDEFEDVYSWTGKWGQEIQDSVKAGELNSSDVVNFIDLANIQVATLNETIETDLFTDSVEIELVTE